MFHLFKNYMSNLPISDHPYNNIIEDFEFLRPFDPLDDSLSLYQEILQSPSIAPAQFNININEKFDHHKIRTDEATKNSTTIHVKQLQELSTPQGHAEILDNGLKLMKITTPNSKNTRKKNSKTIIKEKINASMELQSAEEEGPSSSKKMDHNAKERIRRMKLNASYLALRALLPDTRRSKKRWSAPAIVDKVLKYIPELENEVEALRSKKENAQSAAAKSKIKNINANENSQYQNSTISINNINQDEAIIQISMPIREDGNEGSSSFANLMECVEDEGISIKSASRIYVCESRISYHLHIQINNTTPGADFIEELRNKVFSWPR